MNLIKITLVAVTLTMAICGCKKKDPSPDNYISYKVDGVAKSSRPEADYLDWSLIIEGKAGPDDITIFFDGDPVPGRYNLANNDTVFISYAKNDNIYDSFSTAEGTLVIDFYDGKRISGVFDFAGSNGTVVKTITEGKFNTKVEQLGYSSPCSIDTACHIENVTVAKLREHSKFVRAGKSNNVK